MVKAQLRSIGFKVVLAFSLVITLIIVIAAPQTVYFAFLFPIAWSVLSCIALIRPEHGLRCAKVWAILTLPMTPTLVLYNGLVPAPLILLAAIIPIILLSGLWRIVSVVVITSATFLVPLANVEYDFAVWLRVCVANSVVAFLVLIFATRLEKALADSNSKSEQLDTALKNERIARQTQSTFIATMSHEIRTPMNGILGLVELVLNSDLSDDQRRKLGQVKHSGAILQQLLNDILDHSKLSEGKLALNNSAMSVEQICKDVTVLFDAPARSKNLSLSLHYDETIHWSLVGDATRITQVLSNLLSNAIKFTHSGKIDFSVALKNDTEHMQTLIFSVQDSGIGISQMQLSSVFDAFTQADSSISRDYGGTGLGLQISKQLVEKMGAQIFAQSQEQQGSRFWFELTVNKSEDTPLQLAYNDDFALPKLQGRVLVVDDNEINQIVAKEMLESESLSVFVVNSGKGAIQATSRNTYDLILMDISMPGMSGVEATLEIRKYDKDTPIISLSAASLDEEVKSAIDAGMNAHLPKPIDKSKLFNMLAQYLPSAPTK